MTFKVTRLGPPRIRRDTIIVGDVVFEAADLAPLTVEDEGTPLATAASTLDFVGAGVTASGAGATKTITIPGGSGLTVEDEGTPLATDATTLDFVGSGVTASGAGATKTITIPGGSGITVEDEGSPLTTDATTLDFVGAGVTASGAGATKTITIPGGGGGSPYYLDTLTLDATHGDEFDGASLDGIWTPTGAFDADAAKYAVAGTWLQSPARGTAAESIYQTGPTKETFEVITKHSLETASGGVIIGPAIVSSTGTGVLAAIRVDVGQLVIANVATYAYTSDGAGLSIAGGGTLMDYSRGLPVWISFRMVPTALDGVIYFARYSLNGNTFGRSVVYDPSSFTYAKMGWGRLNGGANDDHIAIDRFNVVDTLDIGNNLSITPSSGTVTATASSAFGGFPASNAINGTSADWSPNNGATDYAGAGLYLNIAWSVGQDMNRVVFKERGGDVWGKGHLEVTNGSGTTIVPVDDFISGSSRWHVVDFATITGVTAVRIVCDGSPGANPGFIEVETYLRS